MVVEEIVDNRRGVKRRSSGKNPLIVGGAIDEIDARAIDDVVHVRMKIDGLVQAIAVPVVDGHLGFARIAIDRSTGCGSIRANPENVAGYSIKHLELSGPAAAAHNLDEHIFMGSGTEVTGPPQGEPRLVKDACPAGHVKIGVPNFAAVWCGCHETSLPAFALRRKNRFEISIPIHVGQRNAAIFVLALKLSGTLKPANAGFRPHLRDLTAYVWLQCNYCLRASLHNNGWSAGGGI